MSRSVSSARIGRRWWPNGSSTCVGWTKSCGSQVLVVVMGEPFLVRAPQCPRSYARREATPRLVLDLTVPREQRSAPAGLGLAEIFVVAQHDGRPLPRREGHHERPEPAVLGLGAGAHFVGPAGRARARSRWPAPCVRHFWRNQLAVLVDHRAAHVGVRRAMVADARTSGHRRWPARTGGGPPRPGCRGRWPALPAAGRGGARRDSRRGRAGPAPRAAWSWRGPQRRPCREKVRPIVAMVSHSGPTMPAMYCSGLTANSRARPPRTALVQPIQRA